MADKYRGHKIIFKKGIWLYNDTNKTVKSDKNIPCGFCGRPNTKEGHDACLGIIPRIMNACCGHGNIKEAYIQFSDSVCIRDKEALNYIMKC